MTSAERPSCSSQRRACVAVGRRPVELLDSQGVLLPEDVDVGYRAEEEEEEKGAEKGGEYSHSSNLMMMVVG